MGVVHDQLPMARKFRMLTVVDTRSRLCPATAPRFACRGDDVAQTWEHLCAMFGCPKTKRAGCGGELPFWELEIWAFSNDPAPDLSRPGAPTYLGFIEAFDSKLRAELLDAH